MMDSIIGFAKTVFKFYIMYLIIATICLFSLFKFYIFPAFDGGVENTLNENQPIVKIYYSGYNIKDENLRKRVNEYNNMFLTNVENKTNELNEKFDLIEKLKTVNVTEKMYETDCSLLISVINSKKFLNRYDESKLLLQRYKSLSTDCNFRLEQENLIKL